MRALAAAVNPAPLWDQACVPHLSAALVTSSERKGRAIPMTVFPAALTATRLILALTSACSLGAGSERAMCLPSSECRSREPYPQTSQAAQLHSPSDTPTSTPSTHLPLHTLTHPQASRS